MSEGLYVIETPSSANFQAAYSARRDLTVALELIEGYLNPEINTEGSDIGQALWMSALIRYIRARKGYRGKSIHKMVWSGLTPEEKLFDAELRLWRDKLYAHTGGIGEDLAVKALVNPGPSGLGYKVYGASIAMTHVTSPGIDNANKFQQLLEKLTLRARALEDEMHQKVLLEAQAMPIEKIISGRLYKKEIHFDVSSPQYARELAKYMRQS